MASVMSDRMSKKKMFAKHHGMKTFPYWVARYIHDLVFYLPISFTVASMVSQFDPHMKLAPTLVFL